MNNVLGTMVHVGDHQESAMLLRVSPVKACHKYLFAIIVRSERRALQLDLEHILACVGTHREDTLQTL